MAESLCQGAPGNKAGGTSESQMVEDIHGHIKKLEMHPDGSGNHWGPCGWTVT